MNTYNMSIFKMFGWLIIAGMTFGLTVQPAGAEEKGLKKADREHRNPAPVMIKKDPTADRQVIRVSDEKMVPSRPETLYQPPHRGAPGGRVGGGTRGPASDLPLMYALVPDHVGLSSEAQPRLVWYMSKSTAYPLEFTVIDADNGVNPIIEKPLPAPPEPGVQIIQVSQYDLRLEKGKTYQWFVSLVADPDRRSRDVIAGGVIEVGELPASLAADIAKAGPTEAGRLLAQAGFWYDAMGVVSSNIQTNPSDQALHELRASLLEEVDLEVVAMADRQRGL